MVHKLQCSLHTSLQDTATLKCVSLTTSLKIKCFYQQDLSVLLSQFPYHSKLSRNCQRHSLIFHLLCAVCFFLRGILSHKLPASHLTMCCNHTNKMLLTVSFMVWCQSQAPPQFRWLHVCLLWNLVHTWTHTHTHRRCMFQYVHATEKLLTQMVCEAACVFPPAPRSNTHTHIRQTMLLVFVLTAPQRAESKAL